MKSDDPYPRTQVIGILVFPGFEPLDVWGFIEAFSIARFIGTGYASASRCPFRIELISHQLRPGPDAMPGPVSSFNGPAVLPKWFRDDALDEEVDVLMIPGGFGVRPIVNEDSRDTALLDWVRTMDERVTLMTSVCTGAAILALAGLLDGKPAATNHQSFGWVASFGPRVQWDNVARWVDAGKYVTSAGVSAGTDMAFHLVQRLAGRAVAEAAAIAAEYHWNRDPNAPIHHPPQADVPTRSSH